LIGYETITSIFLKKAQGLSWEHKFVLWNFHWDRSSRLAVLLRTNTHKNKKTKKQKKKKKNTSDFFLGVVKLKISLRSLRSLRSSKKHLQGMIPQIVYFLNSWLKLSTPAQHSASGEIFHSNRANRDTSVSFWFCRHTHSNTRNPKINGPRLDSCNIRRYYHETINPK
jgi:hypothetical protein